MPWLRVLLAGARDANRWPAQTSAVHCRACADGFMVRAVEYDIGAVQGAQLRAEGYTGRAKMVVDSERHVLLGVTFLGPGLVDLLHAATIAVSAEIPLDRLWHAVPVFPTVSEVWLYLLEEAGL